MKSYSKIYIFKNHSCFVFCPKKYFLESPRCQEIYNFNLPGKNVRNKLVFLYADDTAIIVPDKTNQKNIQAIVKSWKFKPNALCCLKMRCFQKQAE